MAKKLDVLLVEDNDDHIFLTKTALEQIANGQALRVHVVTDGDQAIDFVRKRDPFKEAPTPDLVLLDIKLPNKNGFEVLRSFKRDQRFRAIPIVMLTSSDDEKDILDSYALGSNSYITKPIQTDELSKKLTNIPAYWFQVNTLPSKA